MNVTSMSETVWFEDHPALDGTDVVSRGTFYSGIIDPSTFPQTHIRVYLKNHRGPAEGSLTTGKKYLNLDTREATPSTSKAG